MRTATSRKRSGTSVRISYRKALDALIAYLDKLNVPDADRRAQRILEPLLTDRQRKTLDG